jgi:hypothetical protein
LKKNHSKKAVLIIIACFCLALPFLPKKSGGDGVDLLRTISVQKRLSNDQEILQSMNQAQWLIGRGLFVPAQNRVVRENIPSHAHFADNLLVFLISNLGIIGATTLLVLILSSRALTKNRIILFSTLASHAMFNNNLTQSFAVLIFLGFYLTKDE